MACLLTAFWLLGVAWDLMLEALGDAKGLAWVPECPGDRQNGLDGTPVRAGALFYWDAGIQGTAKV